MSNLPVKKRKFQACQTSADFHGFEIFSATPVIRPDPRRKPMLYMGGPKVLGAKTSQEN